MQLRVLAALALGTAFAVPAGAGPREDAVSYDFRYFNDVDGIQVATHMGRYHRESERGLGIDAAWKHERVVMPGVEAPAGSPEAVDAITSASRPISGAGNAYQDFQKTRNEFETDLSYRSVTAGYYLSMEKDYLGQQVRASTNRDFFRKNLNLYVGGSYGWDSIEPLADDDTDQEPDHRSTWDVTVAATQVLGPSTVLRAGVDAGWVRGLQHNPYRNVYAGGGPRPEHHPDSRERGALFVKLAQYFKNRSSIQVGYRYYTDDWGVRSHTLSPVLSQYISDKVIARYRYRYYAQEAGDFYREEYESADGIDGYMTGDYRLGTMNAHLFGGELEINLGGVAPRSTLFRRVDLRLQYERYFNTNNFSADLFETGLGYRF